MAGRCILQNSSTSKRRPRGLANSRPDNMADVNSFRLHAPATSKSIADTRCRVICARGGACTVCYTLSPLKGPEAPTAR